MGALRRRLAICALGLSLWAGGVEAQTPVHFPPSGPASGGGAPAFIRAAADGAGVSHLLWIAPDPGGQGDIIGVIDPLYSAVRLYRVATGTAPLRTRLSSLGACALPPTDGPDGLRPWRIVTTPDSIDIQAVPVLTGPPGQTHRAPVEEARSRVYRMNRSIADWAAVAATGQTLAASERGTGVWLPARQGNVPCGVWLQEPASLAAGSAGFTVTRTDTGAAHLALASAPAGSAPIPLVAPGRIDHVMPLTTTGPDVAAIVTWSASSSDGIFRFGRMLQHFKPDGVGVLKPVAAWAIDPSALRAKMAVRPVTMLPSGEVLMVGRDFTEPVTIGLVSCGVLGSGAPDPRCGSLLDVARMSVPAAGVPAAPERQPGAWADVLFGRTAPALSLTWSFDASRIPEACRGAWGCLRGDGSPQPAPRQDARAWVPLTGQRLSDGTYSRVGLPYAQGPLMAPDRFRQAEASFALAGASAGRQGAVPGNLADLFEPDAGIDCTVLVNLAWTGSVAPLNTSQIQDGGRPDLICPTRVPFEGLVAGDVINLVVRQGSVRLTNHAVLFARTIRTDGDNLYMQVLESSSSCDGVCWSFHEPGFYAGWGGYRRTGRPDAACPLANGANSRTGNAFPAQNAAWRREIQVR